MGEGMSLRLTSQNCPIITMCFPGFCWQLRKKQCGELLGNYGIRLGLLRTKRHRYHRYGKTSPTWDIFEVCPYTGWYCPGRVCHISAFKTQHWGNTPNRRNAKNNIPPETLQTWGLLYYSLSLYNIHIYIYNMLLSPKIGLVTEGYCIYSHKWLWKPTWFRASVVAQRKPRGKVSKRESGARPLGRDADSSWYRGEFYWNPGFSITIYIYIYHRHIGNIGNIYTKTLKVTSIEFWKFNPTSDVHW